MTAYDFVQYCFGVSMIIFSIGFTWAILQIGFSTREYPKPPPPPKPPEYK